MAALIRMGVLINKNTFEGGRLFERSAYWKEGTKSNHYGTPVNGIRLGRSFTKIMAPNSSTLGRFC